MEVRCHELVFGSDIFCDNIAVIQGGDHLVYLQLPKHCLVRPCLRLPQQPLWNKEAQPEGELLPLETDVCDRNPHRVTHPISLFPLIIEGNWVVISG